VSGLWKVYGGQMCGVVSGKEKENEDPVHRVIRSSGGHVRKPITINFRQPSRRGRGLGK